MSTSLNQNEPPFLSDPAYGCFIVPPFILDAVIRSGAGNRRQLQDSARENLRIINYIYKSHEILPSPTDSPQAPGARTPRKYREVYDMAGRSDTNHLPGYYICSDDSAPHDTSTDIYKCYENLGLVYDYYLKVHGRDSINNEGLALRGSIHFGKSFPNALWLHEYRQMVFGDGDGTIFAKFTECLEVVGHEMTHGVIQSTANLAYENQPGALNESIADVFGSLAKQYYTEEKSTEADWLIGRTCFLLDVENAAIRSMKDPGTAHDDPRVGKDPQPKSMDNYKESGDVHWNSGIPNYAFYLVAIGLAKAGLGEHAWDLAGPIWYKALIHEDMKPQCQFKDFALITCKIAGELAGENSIVAERVVKEAWETVRVLEQPIEGQPAGQGGQLERQFPATAMGKEASEEFGVLAEGPEDQVVAGGQ